MSSYPSKYVFNTLKPCIVNLIHSSLMSSSVPAALRRAVMQTLQSGSTETAFLTVFNGQLVTVDAGNSAVLLHFTL